MVGSDETLEVVRKLAELCAELKISEVDLQAAGGAGIHLKMHDLALKQANVRQSGATTPGNSDPPAKQANTANDLRFGSGSR